MDRKELEIKLQELVGFEDPDPELEQYRTPPELAASLLWTAHMRGEIKDKGVYDLGCGTGTLGIGAKLLGASEVTCVEVDEHTADITRENAERLGVDIEVLVSDVSEVSGEADLVLQNPPFGSQESGSDRPFIEKSLELAPVVYSFHMAETDKFIRRYVKECGGEVADIEGVDFPLERTMPWHEKEIETVEVNLYRFERK